MLKFLVVLSVFVGIISSEKPGECPPALPPPACIISSLKLCETDEGCFGPMKCCKNDCGGAICLPVFPKPPVPVPEEKSK
ncbi:waprin-Thr1-like [Tribolium madens]|uniref:waprin-Thr1-like n=1 Tax=Tribolium madens TaxID=41895 RepID=UPI001CF71EF2|nr:waprin-Thr1-like [Tribolium madens]